MRRPAQKREGQWTEMPVYVRKRAHRLKCQVCHRTYGTIRCRLSLTRFMLLREHIDHLIPRRWLKAHGINPHQANNLISVCGSCHGQKLGFENKFFHSDLYGYLSGLRSLNYPVSQVINFALSVGLKEFGRFA
jgi:hypothetical protein